MKDSTVSVSSEHFTEHLRDWQRRLLRVCHLGATVALLVGATVVVLWLGTGALFGAATIAFCVGLANAALLAVRQRCPHLPSANRRAR